LPKQITLKKNSKTAFSSWLSRRQNLVRTRTINAEKIQKEISELKFIFKKYKLKRVYLFGSILNYRSHENSDIDLYVEKLETNQFWNLWRDLEESLDHPVDLYYQSDDPKFIRKIKNRGRLIYES